MAKISAEKINRLKQVRAKFKRQRFMKTCIVFLFLSVVLFTIATFVVFVITGNEPSTLVSSFFGFFGLEGGAMAIIKTSESITSSLTNKTDSKSAIEKSVDGITEFIGDSVDNILHNGEESDEI